MRTSIAAAFAIVSLGLLHTSIHAADSAPIAFWHGDEMRSATADRVLLTTPTHLFKIVHRTASNAAPAESHEGVTDIYFVIAGSGAIVAGGELENPAPLAGMPGELRSPHLKGGTRYALEPNAVLNIPPTTPYVVQPGPAGVTMVLLKVNVGMHPWSIVSTQQTTLAASPEEARASVPMNTGQGSVVYWSAADMQRAHMTMAAAAAAGRPINDPRPFVPIPATRTHAYNFLHRTMGANGRPPGVEFHEGNTDIYFIVAGTGTLMTEGVIENREPIPGRPGEDRGTLITHGKGIPLKTGDVVNMPPSTPHQSLPDPGGFSYLLVKVNVNAYPWTLIAK